MTAPLNDDRRAMLREQARDVEERYPELFAALLERDRTLSWTLARIPHPADIENSAAFDLWGHISANLSTLGPGLAELARREPALGSASRWSSRAAGR